MTADPRLLAKLLGPAHEQVNCDECFALLDRYVELDAAGQDASAEMPAMASHLAGCPACLDEYESLLALVTMPGPPRP